LVLAYPACREQETVMWLLLLLSDFVAC